MGVVGLAYLLPKPYRSTAVIQQAFTTISGERGFPWLRKEPEMKFSDIPSLLAWFLLGELLLWFSLDPSLLPFPRGQFSCTLPLRADNSLLCRLID